MTRDYKDTVFLPTTSFDLRANLPQREPLILQRWRDDNLYAQRRAARRGRPNFVLHDGPPYANGNIHIGHALNKILKDVVMKIKFHQGFDVPYVPGWDCHGLPIEWKVEERYRAAGQHKDAVDILTFRAECRDFAQHWLAVQSEDFQRLGVLGDWANPYSTMTFAAEAAIVREIHKFVDKDLLYQGKKSVLWSTVEETALAEAEVEYHDHKSTAIYVKFPVISASNPLLAGAAAVIWTTTPWTIPANRAIAFNPAIQYVIATAGDDKVIVAAALLEALNKQTQKNYTPQHHLSGEALAGTVAAHPWRGQGYDFPVPLLAADFVTTDAGTGLVHIAPSHGEDDFNLGRQHNLEVPDTVQGDGLYNPQLPIFGAQRLNVLELGKDGKYWSPASRAVVQELEKVGALLAKHSITHSYPHSWRSKAPLIFRATPQWFIAMDGVGGLRQKALAAIQQTKWFPAVGAKRITGMVSTRPDWCISRQRAWGVPIMVFVDKESGALLRDPAVQTRIAAAVEQHGADIWYRAPNSDFITSNPDAYTKVMDIVDVWFESGATHAFVFNAPDVAYPVADLYLEGSDQHRGWFQSSLLESCGTRGVAPFKQVLTHGFILDDKGLKLSKSAGNAVAPALVTQQWGADILRLWVVNSDYTQDLPIGEKILQQNADIYRRFRNTLRYLLGSLYAFSDAEKLPVAQLPELERWVLHRLAVLDATMREAFADYDLHKIYAQLHEFCANDLSAFYFDIRKDSLYCDSVHSLKRRACRTVLDILFNWLTIWLAPVLSFTAEEAWQSRYPTSSVHTQDFVTVPASWLNDKLAERWQTVRAVRAEITAAIEVRRKNKDIGSSLEAAPDYSVSPETAAALDGIDMAEVCITSRVTLRSQHGQTQLTEGAVRLARETGGHKCERCWKILPEVTSAGGVCRRCAAAVTDLERQAS